MSTLGGNGDLVLARTDPPADDPPNRSFPNQSPVTRKAARWADLRLRILSAAVLAPLALGCIWLGGAAFTGLVVLIAAGLAYEWLGLCRQRSSLSAALLFTALPLSVVLTEYSTVTW